MSIASEIERIRVQRNKIAAKLQEMGVLKAYDNTNVTASLQSGMDEDGNDEFYFVKNADGTITVGEKNVPSPMFTAEIVINTPPTSTMFISNYPEDTYVEYEGIGDDDEPFQSSISQEDIANANGYVDIGMKVNTWTLFVSYSAITSGGSFEIIVGFPADNDIAACATAADGIPVYSSYAQGVIEDNAGSHMDIDINPGYHKSYATGRIDYPSTDNLTDQIDALNQRVTDLEEDLEEAEQALADL